MNIEPVLLPKEPAPDLESFDNIRYESNTLQDNFNLKIHFVAAEFFTHLESARYEELI
jgi:hypothetical protein